MFHAIAQGYAAMSDPEIFRTHLKAVKSREREIWVDTFANVSRYEKERDDAKLTLTSESNGATCKLGGTLDPKLYDVPLTMVIDGKGITAATAERTGRKLPVRVANDSIYIDAAPSPESISVTWK